MIKKIKEKLNSVKAWVKKNCKKLAIATAGVALAAIGADILLNPPIPSVVVDNQTISFPYTDENSNENIIIRTDKAEYISRGNTDVYVMVENKSGQRQTTNLQFFFPKQSITINSVAVMKPHYLHDIIIPDFATTSVQSTSTGKISIQTIKVGEHKESVIGNAWIDTTLLASSNPEKDIWLAKGYLKEKPKPNQRADKKVQEPILDNGISYFKVNIQTSTSTAKIDNMGFHATAPPVEFYIEAIGSEGGYGLLDPTLFEYFNTGEDSQVGIFEAGAGYTQRWGGQIFTAGVNYKITSVKILVFRDDTWTAPGTLTLEIQGVSGGHPNGTAIASGTYNADTITLNATGEWIEVSLGAGTDLTISTQYSIVVRISGVAGVGGINWKLKNAGGYADGNGEYRNDGTWTSNTNDFMFENWGTAIGGSVAPQMRVQIIEE